MSQGLLWVLGLQLCQTFQILPEPQRCPGLEPFLNPHPPQSILSGKTLYVQSVGQAKLPGFEDSITCWMGDLKYSSWPQFSCLVFSPMTELSMRHYFKDFQSTNTNKTLVIGTSSKSFYFFAALWWSIKHIVGLSTQPGHYVLGTAG